MFTYIYKHLYIYMYICIYVYIHVYIQINTQKVHKRNVHASSGQFSRIFSIIGVSPAKTDDRIILHTRTYTRARKVCPNSQVLLLMYIVHIIYSMYAGVFDIYYLRTIHIIHIIYVVNIVSSHYRPRMWRVLFKPIIIN